MALSLAACGGSSTTTTTPVVETPVVDTPVVDDAVSYSLTKSSVSGTGDNLNGGSGADTFNGLIAGTFEEGDVIDGGDGVDTLQIALGALGDVATQTGTAVTNVENVEVRFSHDGTQADAITLDLNNSFEGVEKVTLYRAENTGTTADPVFTVSGNNFTTAVALELVGGDADADGDAVDVTATYSAVTGTADSASLSLVGAANNTVTIDAIETLNIATSAADTSVSTTGASSLLSLVADDAKTVNISGDGALTVAATDFAATVTIDASTLTGDLDVTAEGTTKLTFTGGSGDDTLTFGAASEITADDTLVGGAGDDTLETSASSLSAGEIALIKSQVSGFEKLGITDAGSNSFDYNDIDEFDHIVFAKDSAMTGDAGTIGDATAGATGDGTDATDAIALTGIEAGDEVTILKAVTGGAGGAAGTATANDGGDGSDAVALTPEVDGGSDAFVINLDDNLTGGAGGSAVNSTNGASGGAVGDGGDGGDAINAATIDELTINVLGTGAITIDGGAGGAGNSSTGADGSDGDAVVLAANGELIITGAADLTINEVVGTNLTISAGSFTGDLTITDEGGNNTIVLGSGDDTVTKTGGTDTITTGAGADKIVLQDASNDTVNDAGKLIVTDFSSTDVLSVDKSGLALPGTAADPLGAADYYEGDVDGMTAGTDYAVVVLTDAYASFGDAEAALAAASTATTDALVGFVNSTTGNFEIYHDSNKSADNSIDSTDLMVSMTNIDNVTDMASILSNESFILVS